MHPEPACPPAVASARMGWVRPHLPCFLLWGEKTPLVCLGTPHRLHHDRLSRGTYTSLSPGSPPASRIVGGREQASLPPLFMSQVYVAFSFLRCWHSVDSFMVDGQTPRPFFRLSRKYVLRYLNSLQVSSLPVSSTCLAVTLLGRQSGQPAAPQYLLLPGRLRSRCLAPCPWLQIGRLELGEGCRGQSGSCASFSTVSQAACPLPEQRDPRKSQHWKEVTVVVFFRLWRFLIFPENNIWR